MTDDGFDATFHLRIDRATAWARLTSTPAPTDGATDPAIRAANDTGAPADRIWLPGFDSVATVTEVEPADRLRATKDDEPCAGTDIVVTLTDDGSGTRIHVVQSRFGDWFDANRDVMAIGWRFIVADLQTYLATGVHAQRHLRRWGDLGATATERDGGLVVEHVRDGGLADRLGLAAGDLLVGLAGAPVASLDDLVTVLRVVEPAATPAAEWIHDGERCGTGSGPG